MSRSLDKGSYFTRWSEPILRRHPPCMAPTSEEEVSSVRRSDSSSPLLANLQSSTNACCTCCGNCSKKKASKNRPANETKKSGGTKTRRIRESLELQLIGTQVEEALAGDRQSALIQHLDLATNTLEALIQHIQSLQVCHLAAFRVLDFAHQLVLPYSISSDFCTSTMNSDLTNTLQQAEVLKEEKLQHLKIIMEICSKNVLASERLQTIIDEHRMRRDDFSMAAKNFKNLLDNSKLSVSQMDKLHNQYQSILIEYQRSRRALDTELPKIVRTRLDAIRQSFQLMIDFYEDFDYNKETANVFKLIGENLCQDEPAVNNVSCKESSNNEPPELCQKCKVNRVDKK